MLHTIGACGTHLHVQRTEIKDSVIQHITSEETKFYCFYSMKSSIPPNT